MRMNFNLKYIRDKNNLTQRQMAKILNISAANYNYFETQERVITLYHLNNLCNKFKVSMDFVLGLSDKNITPKETYYLDSKLIGERLKSIRKSKDLTQEEMAKLLNTSQSTISSYEHGKTLILTAFLYETCKRLNVSADYISGRSNIIKIHNSN